MLNPEWFYSQSTGTFVAFANSDANCSRYDFGSDGVPLRRSPERRSGSFAEAYKADLRSMQRIGTLMNHLNIHEAVKRGRLSDIVLAELRRNTRLR